MTHPLRKFLALILIFSAVLALNWQPEDKKTADTSLNRAPDYGQPSQDRGNSEDNRNNDGQNNNGNQGNNRGVSNIFVSEPVEPQLSIPASKAPPVVITHTLDREVNPRMNFNNVDKKEDATDTRSASVASAQNTAYAPDSSIKGVTTAEHTAQASTAFTSPIVNIKGQDYSFVNPPDTIGDIGPNHFVQAINGGGGSVVQIYDKTGAIVKSQFALDSIGTGNCTNGLGDPVVAYDRLANRWVLVEFIDGTNHLCFYISQSPDPTGAYYNYEFLMPSFPDYPKLSVWPTAYFGTANEGAGTAVYAFDRANMLAGNASSFQRILAPSLSGFGFQAMAAAHLDGATPPPTNSAGIFMRHNDSEAHGAVGSADTLEMWAFDVDWTNSANTTFTQQTSIPISEFDSHICGYSNFSCIPQPSGSNPLDPLREVIMNRLQYRNDVGQETLVGTFVTDVDGNDTTGMRWFELRKTSGSWSLHQEGTYAPDAHNRFMGAAAMDSSGNIALGYNVSSSTVYPSLRYTGRDSTDPLGTMTQTETVMATGLASNASNRYGDYSAIGVDPSDDCTFWFTGMYNESAQWSTRIISFRFPSCGTPDFSLTSSVESVSSCVSNTATIPLTIGSIAGFNNTVNLTSNAPGTATFAPASITPPNNSNLTISGATTGTYAVDIVGTSGSNVQSTTVNLSIVAPLTGAPVLIAPLGNELNVSNSPTLYWQPVSGAETYTVEIATDAGFLNIVESSTLASTQFTPANRLSSQTQYYWRVRANNECNSSSYSTIQLFTTKQIVCTAYPSADVAKRIPASDTIGIMESSEIVVANNSNSIIDINVLNFAGSHTYVSDLNVSLTSPANTTINLFNELCGNQNNFDLNLDDQAATNISCPLSQGNTEQPNNALATFNGQVANGTWTLDIEDTASGDSGQLNSWELEICHEVVTPDFSISLPEPSISSCVGTPVSVLINSDAVLGFNNAIDFSTFSSLNASFAPAQISPLNSSTLTLLNMPVGTHPIPIVGVSGTISHVSDLTLKVSPLVPDAPVLLDPVNNLIGLDDEQPRFFDWTDVVDVDNYTIEFATDSGFSTIIHTDNSVISEYELPKDTLESGTVYYWRVRGNNGCGASKDSVLQQITTKYNYYFPIIAKQ